MVQEPRTVFHDLRTQGSTLGVSRINIDGTEYTFDFTKERRSKTKTGCRLELICWTSRRDEALLSPAVLETVGNLILGKNR